MAANNPLAPRSPHFAPKAKSVIYLHMSGGPPNLDIFDYKPDLVAHSGEPCPDSFLKGRQFAFTTGVPKLMGSPRTFTQHGKAGMWMSDAVPHFQGIADDITLDGEWAVDALTGKRISDSAGHAEIGEGLRG